MISVISSSGPPRSWSEAKRRPSSNVVPFALSSEVETAKCLEQQEESHQGDKQDCLPRIPRLCLDLFGIAENASLPSIACLLMISQPW